MLAPVNSVLHVETTRLRSDDNLLVRSSNLFLDQFTEFSVGRSSR